MVAKAQPCPLLAVGPAGHPRIQHHPKSVLLQGSTGILIFHPNTAFYTSALPVLTRASTLAEAKSSQPSAALRTWNPPSAWIPTGLFIPPDLQSKELCSRVRLSHLPTKRCIANLPQKLLFIPWAVWRTEERIKSV